MPEATDPGLLANFHFLRPWWLLALMPSLLLSWRLWRNRTMASDWRHVIGTELLPFLLDPQDQQIRRKPFVGALIFWVLTVLALAGPSWSRLPQPVHKQDAPLVILLDLSPSMLAEDLKPNRLTRARLKLTDLLNRRREGTSALIAYAGEAHLVSPLTDDTTTIISLIPSLHPNIMPTPGSDPVAATAMGMELILQAGYQGGDLLLIGDGITRGDHQAITKLLQGMGGFRLSALMVGSEAGAPIPISGGGFMKDKAGNIIVAQAETAPFLALVKDNAGRHVRLSDDESDLDYLLEQWDSVANQKTRQLDRGFDTWQDQGYWLLILALPLSLLTFRRNLIAGWLIAPALLASSEVRALEWSELWQRPDQQGQKAFETGDLAGAIDRFEDPSWRGTAAYRAEDYDQAISAFRDGKTSESRYNLANSLAKNGQLKEALAAYEQLLAEQPGHVDATFNRDLVKKVLEQARQRGDESENQQNQNTDGNSDDVRDRSESQNSEQKEPSGSENSQPQNQDGKQQESPPEDQHALSEQQDNLNQSQQNTEGQEEQGSQTPSAQAKVQQPEELPDEQRQAMEQWLRRVPDDPGGLLRRKFQHQSRMRSYEEQHAQSSEGEQRW